MDQYFFSDISPQQGTQKKNKRMKLHWTESVLHREGNHQENRKQPTERENIFADTSDQGVMSKIYKELTKLNIQKIPNNSIKNGQRNWIDSSPKRTYRCQDIWKDMWKDAQCH